MATVTPPIRDDISGTAPNPSNAVARAGFGALHDYLMNLLGSAGTPEAARTALDVKQLQSIDYTIASGALTLKLNPTNLDFRSTALTTGAPTNVSNASQITTTISSGSTGGTTSAVQSDIIILAINNAGAMELAWTNAAGGINLDEQGVITTVAEGGAGAADSASVIYSNTARAGVAYRVVGLFRSTQTTAGTWAQTPTLVQAVGGQALAAMSGFGFGQARQNLTISRALSTTYYNTTGKPIWVSVTGRNSSGTGANYMQHTVGGVLGASLAASAPAGGYTITTHFIVLPGQSYSCTADGGGNPFSITEWVEVR